MSMTDGPRGAATALPFFVYGTLRPGASCHDAYLRAGTAHDEPGTLPGAALYDGPGYPYAVEVPGPGRIQGELVTALDSDYPGLLVSLDELEEYHGPGDPGNEYERVIRDVHRADGSTTPAWVYLAAPSVADGLRRDGTRLAGSDWLAHTALTGEQPEPTGAA
ncbi:gamma-glutamylcyclotransferase [Streptomyces uncialis]|uniref:gamma-glutamylcyclotransferase family protein n=1 Tax=Streptomyces uncialis TaxID=1048205 RepID=UPI002E35CE9E|nr:gamma-glutamylcyclotransferase family protein [Streptomyces uncialis]